MQLLRFKRYAALFKAALLHSVYAVDLYKVFYKKSVSNYVSPQLRKDLINVCFPGFLADPSLLRQINQAPSADIQQ